MFGFGNFQITNCCRKSPNSSVMSRAMLKIRLDRFQTVTMLQSLRYSCKTALKSLNYCDIVVLSLAVNERANKAAKSAN